MNVVAHNLLAMNADRQFNITGKNKTKSMEKLSSGYRINRAADDAAGLAISEKMRRQIRGLSQGVENTQAGISLCQVADGALAEVSSMLHRITELSVQSANATNCDADRQAIQEEINHITTEINRISDDTSFNTRPLFQGATGTTIIPAVYAPSTVDSFSVSGVPSQLGAGKYRITADASGFKINNDSFAWSDFKNGTASLADSNITAGTYSFNYHGLTLSVVAQDGANINDAIGVLNKSSFTTEVKAYNTNKAADILSINRMDFPDTVTSYGVNGMPSMEYKGNNLVLNSGMLDVEGKELEYSCDLGSNDFTVVYDDGNRLSLITGRDSDTVIPAGSDIVMKMNKSSSAIYNIGNVYMEAKVTETTTFGKLMETMESCILDCTRQDCGDYAYFKKADDNGNAIKLSAATKSLSDAGYSLFDDRDIVFTIQNTTKDPFGSGPAADGNYKSLVSNDGRFVLYPVGGLSEGSTFAFYSEDNKIIVEGQNYGASVYSFNPAKYHAQWLENYHNGYSVDYIAPWYSQKITGMTIPDVLIKTPVIGLDKYEGSGYKGTLVTPEERIYSDEDLKLWIQSGSEAGDGIFLEIERMNTSILGIDDLDISTIEGANHALDAVAAALQKVSANRSGIGAQQNRLEHTVANENNTVENTQSAESLIRDTDMADEMVKYSKHSILEQVGNAMMTQANQSNQGVLSLLQ